MCTKERTGSEKAGKAIGAIPIIGALMLAIGYTVVLGWIFKYTFLSLSGGLFSLGTDMGAIGGTFGVTAPEAETLPAKPSRQWRRPASSASATAYGRSLHWSFPLPSW